MPTIKQTGVVSQRIAQALCYLQLFFLLAFKMSNTDKVLLYHDRGISVFFSLIRKIIKRKYYYYLGEIFAAVYDRGNKAIQSEISTIKGAQGYVLINYQMPQLLGINSNYCVCHGSYESHKTQLIEKNEIVHVVYAGKIAQENVTDAFLAVKTAEFLNDKYRVHILGYGEDKDIEALNKLIKKTNEKRGIQIVSYDGCLFGEDYEQFLKKCDVGLCTRTLEEYRANLCFPSKVIVYLSNGLNVICPDSEVIKTSDVCNCVSFVSGEMSPENIAKIVMGMQFQGKTEIMDKIKRLDEDFRKQIDKVFSV